VSPKFQLVKLEEDATAKSACVAGTTTFVFSELVFQIAADIAASVIDPLSCVSTTAKSFTVERFTYSRVPDVAPLEPLFRAPLVGKSSAESVIDPKSANSANHIERLILTLGPAPALFQVTPRYLFAIVYSPLVV